jgi:hypothetical protein
MKITVSGKGRSAAALPVSAGPITNATEQENLIKIIFAINRLPHRPSRGPVEELFLR